MDQKDLCQVVIATTEGPSEIISLIAETNPKIKKSQVFIGKTKDKANIDKAYHSFVGQNAGIIKRSFGNRKYTTRVSRRIDVGNSWQLGMFIAHALQDKKRLFQNIEGDKTPQASKMLLWMTGEIDQTDFTAKAVEGIPDKLRLSLDIFHEANRKGRKILVCLPKENEADKTVLTDDMRATLKALDVEIIAVDQINNLLTRLDLQPEWSGNPYRGLETFEAKHRKYFFGRDKAIADCLNRLGNPAEGEPDILLLHGRSGAGKSSLARCGLAVDLKEGNPAYLPLPCVFTPNQNGASPLQALIKALQNILDEESDSHDHIEETASQIADRLLKQLDQNNRKLLLIVDQLEELFLWARDIPAKGKDRESQKKEKEAEQDSFAQLIERLAVSGQVTVIATIRSDFIGLLDENDTLFTLLGERQYQLPRPTLSEITQMIREPADMAGLEFETRKTGLSSDTEEASDENLANLLAATAIKEPNSLPLLQFLLARLAEQSDDGRITFQQYADIGELKGAIGEQADETVAHLLEGVPDKKAMNLAIDRMILSISRYDTDIRKAVSRIAVQEAGALSDTDRHVIKAFDRSRLIIAEEKSDTVVIRPAHDALLQYWQRAKETIEKNLDDLKLRDTLDTQARLWEEKGKKPIYLIPKSSRLKEAKHLKAEKLVSLAPETEGFIHLSKRNASQNTVKKTAYATVAVLLVSFMGGGIYWQQKKAEFMEPANQIVRFKKWYETHKYSPIGMRIHNPKKFFIPKKEDESVTEFFKRTLEYNILSQKDLNGDKILDFVVHNPSPAFCGQGSSGCAMNIFVSKKNGTYYSALDIQGAADVYFLEKNSIGATQYFVNKKPLTSVYHWDVKKYTLNHYGICNTPRLNSCPEGFYDKIIPARDGIKVDSNRINRFYESSMSYIPSGNMPILDASSNKRVLNGRDYNINVIGMTPKRESYLVHFVRREVGFIPVSLVESDSRIKENIHDVSAYIDHGFELLKLGEIWKADVAFKKAIELKDSVRDQVADIYFKTGSLYQSKSLNKVEALIHYNKSLMYKPKNERLLQQIELKHRRLLRKIGHLRNKQALKFGLNATIKNNDGQSEEALIDIQKAISLYYPDRHSSLAALYNIRGDINYKMGNIRQAQDDHRKTIEIDRNLKSKTAFIFIEKGNDFLNRKDYKLAGIEYLKAISRDPNSARAYSGLGTSYYLNNKKTKGEDAFKKALSIDSGKKSVIAEVIAETYNHKGLEYYKSKDYKSALREFKKSLLLNPTSASALTNAGTSMYFLGDTNNAEILFKKAVNLDVAQLLYVSSAYYLKGLRLYITKKYHLAIEEFLRAIDYFPHKAEYYTYLGMANYMIGNKKISYKNFSLAISKSTHQGRIISDFFSQVGNDFLGNDNYAMALEMYDNSIQFNNKNAAAYMYRGFSNYMLGKKGKAQNDFVESKKLHPPIAKQRAFAYNQMGSSLFNKGKFSEAILESNKAIAINPKVAIFFIIRGKSFYMLRNVEKAEKDYTKAISLDPNQKIFTAEAYNLMGNKYWKNGRYDKALAEYEKSVDTNPKLAVYFTNRGNAHYILGHTKQAEKDYAKAISLDPKQKIFTANGYSRKGWQYRNKGLCHQAASEFNKAIIINPSLAQNYIGRGQCYRDLGQFGKALKDFATALRLNPKLDLAYTSRAKTRVKMALSSDKTDDELKETLLPALADTQEALKLNKKMYIAWFWQGETYRLLKDHEKALNSYNAAIKAFPNRPQFLVGRGKAYELSGQTSQAIADYKKAIGLKPLVPIEGKLAQEYARKRLKVLPAAQ